MTLPLRIVAWVGAVVLGLGLAWVVASGLGFVSRSQIIDMFRSSNPVNYVRLFLLVPVWAFMSACLATLFIEGARWYGSRRDGVEPSGKPPKTGAPNRAVSSRLPETGARTDARETNLPLPPGQRTRIRPREPTP